ncbi:MAG: energy transducer TonB [Caulobacteraceae bacterium]|nr:energy transducer TonB [Caulobacteraceae bacterium]
MPGAAAVTVSERRGGLTRTAVFLSILAHLAFLYWIYQWAPPQVRAAVNERIIPIFVTPRPIPALRPPEVLPEEAPRRAPDPGGRSGEGSDTPAIPVRQPQRLLDPERVVPLPAASNPDPQATTLVSNAGSGAAPGDGAGTRAGPGSGEGSGEGAGRGPGSGPGGRGAAETWKPSWRRLPSEEQMTAVFPEQAWKDGVSGGATLECTVMVTGRVKDCIVKIETPPGQGFGAAVLSLSRYFVVTPRRINGRPVEARINIPYMMIVDKYDKPVKPRAPISRSPEPRTPDAPAQPPPRG